MRLFVAINLDEATRLAIHEATAPLRSILPGARWVEPRLLHITVKFLGQRTVDFAGKAAQVLRDAASSYDSIPMEIGLVGAFPNLRRPSVVWMGIQSEPKLELLHHDVEAGCAALGAEVDGRPFRPHITLARVRAHPIRDVRAFTSACDAVRYHARANVRSLDLMLSEHRDGRLEYTVLETAMLRGG